MKLLILNVDCRLKYAHQQIISLAMVILFKQIVFTARRSYASAVLGVVILSVGPSVCPSVTRVLCD